MSYTSSKIGIPGIEDPTKKCNDVNCPFHGNLKVRGRIFMGKVVKTKMLKAITVIMRRTKYNKKYKRYERRNTKISVYLPPCIEVKSGDTVRFIQCRPLSKTISSTVIQKIEKEV